VQCRSSHGEMFLVGRKITRCIAPVEGSRASQVSVVSHVKEVRFANGEIAAARVQEKAVNGATPGFTQKSVRKAGSGNNAIMATSRRSPQGG